MQFYLYDGFRYTMLVAHTVASELREELLCVRLIITFGQCLQVACTQKSGKSFAAFPSIMCKFQMVLFQSFSAAGFSGQMGIQVVFSVPVASTISLGFLVLCYSAIILHVAHVLIALPLVVSATKRNNLPCICCRIMFCGVLCVSKEIKYA